MGKPHPRPLRREVGHQDLRRLQVRRQGLRLPRRRRGLGHGLQCRHPHQGRHRSRDPRQLRRLQGRLREDRRAEEANSASSPSSPWPPASTWAGSPPTTTSTPCCPTACPTATCPWSTTSWPARSTQPRLSEYADWVELLFKYADKAVLTTGNYDSQVGAFATGKAVFLHQGNWVDPNIKGAKATFKMAFAPHGSMKTATDGIFVAAPSFYAINKDSKNVAAAKKFLNDLVYTAGRQQVHGQGRRHDPRLLEHQAPARPASSPSPSRPGRPPARSTAGTSTTSPAISATRPSPRSTTSSPPGRSTRPSSST